MTTFGADGAVDVAHRPTRRPGRVAGVLGLVVVAVLAWSFAVLDEPISRALRSPDAGWAVALEMYGQLPGVVVGIVGATILLRLAVPARGVRGWVGAVLVVTMLMLSSLQVALELGAHAGGETDVRRAVLVALPVTIAALVASRWVSPAWAASVRPAALIALTLPYLASVVTVWAIKIPWGRWTPRDITAAGDPALFSPWYLPQGVNGHYSFVSGHTSFAVAVIALVLVVARTRRAFAVGVLVCLAWGVVCAVSRVVLGAHFPSDTLFAAVATLAWVVLLAKLVGYRPPPPQGTSASGVAADAGPP